MGYRPLGPYIASSKASMSSSDAIRRVCRGNMILIWNFLIKRVKSEKTVDNIRRNILVHGGKENVTAVNGGVETAKTGESRRRNRNGRRKEKVVGSSIAESKSRETTLQERESAEKEVERLRHMVRRQRKELKRRQRKELKRHGGRRKGIRAQVATFEDQIFTEYITLQQEIHKNKHYQEDEDGQSAAAEIIKKKRNRQRRRKSCYLADSIII
ncbi:hypothetical protein L1887_18535 [Cichorium endivia]|nr:hypothetical protein L1887_18535 [Cichorium endivia]